MHHITYTDYYGREQLVKIPAAHVDQLHFLLGQLRNARIPFHHVFWD